MNKYHAPALDKGLDIIEYLSKKAVPQSQAEISQGIQKGPNEIYRMLICLEQRGYLIRDKESGNYTLSLKLFHISHRHSPVDEIIKSAKPIMETLSNKTSQACHMSILYNGKLLVIAQTRSPGPVSLSIEEGSLFPLVKTTSGRVLLSFLNKEQQKKQLNSLEEYNTLTAAKKKEFLSILKEINDCGYHILDSEITLGVTDIAVPVGNEETGVLGVLAISCLSKVAQANNSFDNLIEEMLNAAQDINKAIGLHDLRQE